jgi:uncharacterized protein DUF6968
MVQSDNEIASTEMTAVLGSGERLPVRISIERPCQTPHGDWCCRALGSPVVQSSGRGVSGVDSLQALALAISYLRFQLNHFVSKGGRLVYPNDGEDEDVDIDAIFGSRWDRTEDLNG